MNKKDLELLFEYDRWANARVLQSASELTEAQLTKDLSSSFASLRDTLVHIYIGEWLWLQRWKGISPETLPTSEDFPDLTSLRTEWTLVEREQAKFISEVAEETLQKAVSYVNTEGEKCEYPLWQIIYQAASHSNYHRGQTATMLRQLEAKPLATDFLIFSGMRVTKELLENERQRIYEEIKHYPTPIPACDAQFNYLLEERARIDQELNRLKALSKQGKKSMIETENLKIIPCELAHFEAILNDPRQLEQMLDVSVADEWISFPEAMSYGCEYLKSNPDALGWWTYLFVHTKDKALIGSGGYKGKANESGIVEIGYGIAPSYRSRGLATEAARGLVDYAFAQPHVKAVDAHTLAEANPSTKVLEKIGLRKIETLHDPDEGEIWHWRLERKK